MTIFMAVDRVTWLERSCLFPKKRKSSFFFSSESFAKVVFKIFLYASDRPSHCFMACNCLLSLSCLQLSPLSFSQRPSLRTLPSGHPRYSLKSRAPSGVFLGSPQLSWVGPPVLARDSCPWPLGCSSSKLLCSS